MSVGLALSPLPVAAVMIMLMTARAGRNGPAFLVGWSIGILTVGLVVFVIPGIHTPRGEPAGLSGVLRIVLGAGLLLLAVLQWRRRPVADAPVEVPRLLTRLDGIGVVQALIIGFLLSGVNPANTVLSASGAAVIDASPVEGAERVVALLVFAAIGSVTVALPVAVYFFVRQRAEAMFALMKDWLIRHNLTVMVVLLLAFGALLIGRGMEALAM